MAFQCPVSYCTKNYQSEDALVVHFDEKHRGKEYKCPDCHHLSGSYRVAQAHGRREGHDPRPLIIFGNAEIMMNLRDYRRYLHARTFS